MNYGNLKEFMARSAFPADEQQMDALFEMLQDQPEKAFSIIAEEMLNAVKTAGYLKELDQ